MSGPQTWNGDDDIIRFFIVSLVSTFVQPIMPLTGSTLSHSYLPLSADKLLSLLSYLPIFLRVSSAKNWIRFSIVCAILYLQRSSSNVKLESFSNAKLESFSSVKLDSSSNVKSESFSGNVSYTPAQSSTIPDVTSRTSIIDKLQCNETSLEQPHKRSPDGSSNGESDGKRVKLDTGVMWWWLARVSFFLA